MTIKKRGGIRFIAIGTYRIQVSRKKSAPRPTLSGAGELGCTLACGAFALYGLAQAFARLVTF